MKPSKILFLCAVTLSLSANALAQSSWQGFPSGPMLTHNNKLFFTGGGLCEGPFSCTEVSTWDGSNFAQFGTNAFNNIKAIAVHNDTVYIGTSISGSSTPLFRVDSDQTTEEGNASGGNGVMSARGDIWALISYGGKLIIGGSFSYSDQPFFATNNIVSWDGTDLDSLGAGLNSRIADLEVYGGDLYASGFFTTAGGQSANRIAKWNGTAWSPLGTGLDGWGNAMALYDGDLYVCGDFNNAGGSPARNIARWDGSSWSAVGTGVADIAWRLTTCGDQLYVGGTFKEAGGIGAKFLAGWDGTNWNNVAGGVDSSVNWLACYNGDLVVSAIRPIGDGFESEPYIDVYDGSSWSEPWEFAVAGEGCCFVAGDYNADGTFNISDVTNGVTRIFFGSPPPFCADQADYNGDNIFNIADLTAGVSRIFAGGPPPVCGTTGE